MSGLILIYHTFCFHYVFMTGFPISRLSSFLGTMRSEQSRLHFCCTVINTLALPVARTHPRTRTYCYPSTVNLQLAWWCLPPICTSGFLLYTQAFLLQAWNSVGFTQWLNRYSKQVKLAEVGVNGVVIFAWDQQEPSLTTRLTQLYVENCTLFIVRLLNGFSTSLIKLLSCRCLHGLIFQLNHDPQSSQMQRVFLPVCSWNVH